MGWQEEYNRWLPLVKWILAIPHFVWLMIVAIGAIFVLIAAWFAVLFTGRWPRGMFDYLVNVGRYSTRLTAYMLLMNDKYPSFSLQPQPDDPIVYEVDYPETVERWRPLVAWLLIIPYMIAAGALYYLAEILAFIALFVILFTKKYPRGMFDIVVVGMRWQARANTYWAWMLTKYPPFVWG